MVGLSSPIKWAGGKRQLLHYIIPYFDTKFDTYIEPFLGGGAVFFELINGNILTKEHKIILSDINPDLINLYKCIKENPQKLISRIKKLCEEELTVDNYNDLRSQFNQLRKERKQNDRFKLSVLFLVINKTCFNGLYRLNSSGEFNVPWNKKSYSPQSEIKNIEKISEIFNTYNIEILNEDYKDILKEYITEGSAILSNKINIICRI
jgi:DNA adenine methylase